MKMSKTILTLALAFACNTYAEGVELSHMSHQLYGAIEFDGQIYGVVTVLDEIKTPGGKVYVQPEEYQLQKFVLDKNQAYLEMLNTDIANAADSFKGKITCSFDGAGIRAFTKAQVLEGIDCSWKERAGSGALVKDFKLHLKSYDSNTNLYLEELEHFNNYRVNGETISGEIFLENDVKETVYLDLDVADYRSGTSHNVYIRSKTKNQNGKIERQKVTVERKLDTDGDGKVDTKLSLLSCTNGVRTKGTIDIFVGHSPSVDCNFSVSKKQQVGGWNTNIMPLIVTLK